MKKNGMQELALKSARCGSVKWATSRLAGVTLGAALVLTPALTAAGAPPKGPDANALARKMLAVYKKANSVQADFEAHILQARGSEYIQSGTIRYKTPDRVELYTTDPITGSFHAWADGRSITVYSGKTNVYTKRTAPPGLGPTISGIEKTSEEVLGMRSTQVFSPLSFILAKGMPREAQNFTYLRQDTIQGRKTYCITGKMNVDFLREMLQSRSIIPLQRDVKLWVDAYNNQLVRSACTITWKSPVAGGDRNKPAYTVDGIQFQETYSNVILNASIRDDAFHFTPPQGARQLFQQGR